MVSVPAVPYTRTCSSGNRSYRHPLRPGFPDMLGTLSHHQLKVLDEAGGERVVFAEVLFPAWPRVRWIENLRRHAFASQGHFEAEDRIFSLFDIEQRAAQRRIQ